VESIEVLKDASAAAQYGAQAANGVIVIRTRRGRGDTRVELHSYYGFQKVPKQVPMMNTTQWAALAHQAYANAGWADDSVPSAVVNPPPIATDWQDAVFTTGAIQDHGVSVSGGTANAAYLISAGYVQQDGAIIQTGFQRYNFRVNSQLQRARLTLGENLALSSTRRQVLRGFPLIDVVRFPPAIPVYDSTTSSGLGFGINAVAGFTEQRQTLDRLLAYREGFTDQDLQVIDAGQRSNLDNSGSRFENALRALLVRANYAYKGRYLLTGSLRRDGSSRFAPTNRYGTFGAASVGWVMSQEAFYPSIPVLGRSVDYFKLRASRGVLGNEDIGDYGFSAPIEQNLNYLFGSNVVSSGATQITLANPNIRWQSNRETNVGVDLGLFDDRLTVTGDYYVSTSE